MQYTWSNLNENVTVKRFLANRGVSHRLLSIVKKGGGKVLVNEKRTLLSDRVSGDERVTLWLPPENNQEVLADHEKIDILLENKNWLIVNKPAGLTSVPGPSDRSRTLVNRVKGYLLDSHAEDLVPHVITRLDRFTSGVVLIAKNRLAQGLINKQVEGKTLNKVYLAVVEGKFQKKHGVIEQPIGRENNQIRRSVLTNGQYAKTEYWVVSENQEASLLKVKLHTGRTHQIRVHFAYCGHPLFGDELYGGQMDKKISRQALHAKSLEYTDPFDGLAQRVSVNPPDDILELCRRLKLVFPSSE
ncbi:RluA family pseudouridine synthase [Liquorilactobacillus uvarum]|uniref:RluA family pseudouridine synthase n=1 Tax=Liquorilactobacillus uvarum TaxID=303240 RepID=UPI00288B737A|nr:RluA family pseudouridine synthase [Liquorilactobacillus uvarum]